MIGNNRDLGFQAMTVSLLEDILLKVDRPDEFPVFAAQEFLEITGARTAIMVECVEQGDNHSHRVVAAIPRRRAELQENPAVLELIDLLHNDHEIQTWDPAAPGPHVAPLKALDVGISLAVPLIAGNWRAGGLLLFDLPEIHRVEAVTHVFKSITQVIALAFRSALLFGAQGEVLDAHSKKIQQYRSSLEAFFDNKLVGMVQLDAAGNYLQVNQQWQEMTGYSRAELLQMNFRDLTYPEDRRLESLAAIVAGSATRQTVQRTKRYVRKDGQMFWGSLSGTGLYDERDQFVGLVEMIVDVTESKNAEEQRQSLEIQLRQKYKMEAIGVMAGGIAHNFNNNLAIILGNLELTKMRLSVDSQVSELLENAKTATLRSRDLVLQILAYSRQGGYQKLSLTLLPVIEETLRLLSATIPTTVRLRQDIDPQSKDVVVVADSSQLQEVLINLCNNAVQAMNEDGELTLLLETVELRQQDIPANYDRQPGQYAKLSVQDDGCGMPADILEKIFDPFFTTKEVGQGTGMGLATVQGIIDRHDGLIKVRSSIGQGSRFELYLPVAKLQEVDDALPDQEEMPRGDERILLVDDDEMLVILGDRILSELGYQVTTMTSSLEAVKLFQANPDFFDLLISDQTMPNLTGRELIQELLTIRPDLLSILCTGYSSKTSPEDATGIGIKAFMMKPFEQFELAQTVRRVLDEGSG